MESHTNRPPLSDLIRPMLAFNRKDKKKHESYPCHIQPKLDGIRAMWVDGVLYTRTFEVIPQHILPHIYTALSKVKVPIDGELYIHGMTLGQIVSRTNPNRVEPHEDYASVEYHIYDYVSPQPFSKRTDILYHGFGASLKPLQLVETMLCDSEADATRMFKLYRRLGYEGLMLRKSDSPYGLPADCGNKENRWNCLLKYKGWADLEATITGFDAGKPDGEWANTLGAFVCEYKGVTFKAATGISLIERQYIWNNKEAFRNTQIRIQYECISEHGKPLKPVITCVYAYEE